MKKVIIFLISVFCILAFCSCIFDEGKEMSDNGVKYYPAKENVNYDNSGVISEKDTQEVTQEEIPEEVVTGMIADANSENISVQYNLDNANSMTVYVTPSGKKYHFSNTCPGKNSTEITLDEALTSGREACKKCVK